MHTTFSDKLQIKLRAEGGIRALLGMVRCRHLDVLAQVARGIANFAKCESRASTQGEVLSPTTKLYYLRIEIFYTLSFSSVP